MKKKPASATSQILRYLQSGKPVSPLMALDRWHVFRLADVIFKLRKRGHNIKTDLVENPKTCKVYAKYYMGYHV